MKLFEVLTNAEKVKVKKLGIARNEHIHDLTIQELAELHDALDYHQHPPQNWDAGRGSLTAHTELLLRQNLKHA